MLLNIPLLFSTKMVESELGGDLSSERKKRQLPVGEARVWLPAGVEAPWFWMLWEEDLLWPPFAVDETFILASFYRTFYLWCFYICRPSSTSHLILCPDRRPLACPGTGIACCPF